MRSSKTRGETFTRPSPGLGKLASGYLEATACSNNKGVCRQLNMSQSPFFSNESPMQQGRLYKNKKMEAMLQSLAIAGKENDRLRSNTHQDKATTNTNDPDSVKSLAILNEASDIIKYLHSYVDSDQLKSLKKSTISKKSTIGNIKTQDQSTNTEFDTLKLRFEASFDSIHTEKNDIIESHSKLYLGASDKLQDDLKCPHCAMLQDKLYSEIDQKTSLEEAIEEIQKGFLQKNQDIQMLELRIRRTEDEVIYISNLRCQI
jgi:hypothetical protein